MNFGEHRFLSGRPSRGFTLPEVLLALAILSLAALAVGQAIRGSLALLERARRVEQPSLGLALAREALLRAASEEDAEDGGTLSLPEGDDADWEAEVEVTELPDVFEVELTVDAAGGETVERLFLFRPGWSSPVDRGPLMEEARRQIEDRLEEVNR